MLTDEEIQKIIDESELLGTNPEWNTAIYDTIRIARKDRNKAYEFCKKTGVFGDDSDLNIKLTNLIEKVFEPVISIPKFTSEVKEPKTLKLKFKLKPTLIYIGVFVTGFVVGIVFGLMI